MLLYVLNNNQIYFNILNREVKFEEQIYCNFTPFPKKVYGHYKIFQLLYQNLNIF